jgi:hypothetical protein
MTVLRKNRDDVSKSNSNSFNLRVILQRLAEKDAVETRKLLVQNRFARWTQSELGIEPTGVARKLVLLHSSKWCDLFAKFVETSYGETHFQWTPVEQWIATKLDNVSLTFPLN